ncbi:MAG: diguanylate cyclase, partial [Coleofasciculaceae cyanobacterium RL_1_1]|nr:diguanylate cyclase [Coleofasciculaceae cyanobacterium RL_1_1]
DRIDLNRFNTIRYCLGRDVSDRLLVSVSDRIKSNLARDEHLMRTGEDELMTSSPPNPTRPEL